MAFVGCGANAIAWNRVRATSSRDGRAHFWQCRLVKLRVRLATRWRAEDDVALYQAAQDLDLLLVVRANLHRNGDGTRLRAFPDVVDRTVAANRLDRRGQHALDRFDDDRRRGLHACLQRVIVVDAIEHDLGRVDLLVVATPAAGRVGDRCDVADPAGQHVVGANFGADVGRQADAHLVDHGFLHLDLTHQLGVVRDDDDALALANARALFDWLAVTATARNL